jgi:hypothetical protein
VKMPPLAQAPLPLRILACPLDLALLMLGWTLAIVGERKARGKRSKTEKSGDDGSFVVELSSFSLQGKGESSLPSATTTGLDGSFLSFLPFQCVSLTAKSRKGWKGGRRGHVFFCQLSHLATSFTPLLMEDSK